MLYFAFSMGGMLFGVWIGRYIEAIKTLPMMMRDEIARLGVLCSPQPRDKSGRFLSRKDKEAFDTTTAQLRKEVADKQAELRV